MLRIRVFSHPEVRMGPYDRRERSEPCIVVGMGICKNPRPARHVIGISDPDENFSLREMLYALASEFLTFFADAIILILIISLFF